MFLSPLGIINEALDLLQLIIIADVIMSYIPSLPRRNPVVMLIHSIANYVTSPFRKIIKPMRMGNAYVDFSPILAIVAIQLLQSVLF